MAETITELMNAPGWFDLSSSDPEAAHAFYRELFGWTADVVPDPAAGGYGMFKKDGKEVGGVGPQQNPQQPPSWTVYMLVEDAAATTQKARDAGGMVFVEPMDVMGEGIMAVLADPSGAAFGLWQPGRHSGVELRGEPGSFAWAEVQSRDISSARGFYESVFGWEPTDTTVPGIPYTEFKLNGTVVAGGLQMPQNVPSEVPSMWMAYWTVEDVDAVVARAKELGGSTLMEPESVASVGRFALLRDPQGAAFGVIKPGG